MQQIISFFIKNSTKMLFLLLLVISISLTIQNHSLHRSETINSANVVAGSVYEKMENITTYLSLKSQNEQLVQENLMLKKYLFNKPDSLLSKNFTPPPFPINYRVINANVIKNSYNKHENYLTILGGTLQGIKKDMGVINHNGLVGIVEVVGNQYAIVQSVLNMKSRINARIKNSNHFGSLVWDGKNAGYVQLIDVPRLATVHKGDTIVTGGISDIFPENIPIGKINRVYIDKKTNYYTLELRLFNDMTNLGPVYVIENVRKKEIEQLEAKVNNEQ